MATYYKYQNPSEIGAAPTLDWGTVISNVNQTLQNQEQQRYENREEDKRTTSDILQKLNEVTLTSDPKANAIITRGIYQTKESRMQSYKDLREGKISRSDFNILGQNTKSSIAELQKFSTEYQTRYANFQKALAEGKVTDFSKATQEYMGSFQNMTNKDLIYNPKDGFMYIANLDPETRKVVEGPLGMLPISSLNTEKIYNDTKIDLPTKLASYTDKIQPFIKVIRKGNIETIEGIQQYSQFNDFMTNLVEAIAPDDFAKADLLTQLGIYDVDVTKASTDKTIGSKRAGDNTITPDITKDMKDNLKVALTRFIVANEGYKQTGTEVFAPSRGGSGEGSGKKEVVTTTNDILSAGGRTIPKSGKLTGVANFTISQNAPIVDMSTGLKRKLKNIYFDTENPQNIRMVVQIQDKDDPTKTKDVSYSSFKRTEKIKPERPGGKPRYIEQDPDLAELNNFATKIYSPELGRTLVDWTELIPILQQKGQGARKTGRGTAPAKTTTTKTRVYKGLDKNGNPIFE